MLALPPPERYDSKAWANYGCKDTDFFVQMQENGDFFAIFCFEDAAEALQVKVRVVIMLQINTFTPYTLHQPTPHFRSNIAVKFDINLAFACASVNRYIWLSFLQLRLPSLLPQCALLWIIQNLLGLRASF